MISYSEKYYIYIMLFNFLELGLSNPNEGKLSHTPVCINSIISTERPKISFELQNQKNKQTPKSYV